MVDAVGDAAHRPVRARDGVGRDGRLPADRPWRGAAVHRGV